MKSNVTKDYLAKAYGLYAGRNIISFAMSTFLWYHDFQLFSIIMPWLHSSKILSWITEKRAFLPLSEIMIGKKMLFVLISNQRSQDSFSKYHSDDHEIFEKVQFSIKIWSRKGKMYFFLQ